MYIFGNKKQNFVAMKVAIATKIKFPKLLLLKQILYKNYENKKSSVYENEKEKL